MTTEKVFIKAISNELDKHNGVSYSFERSKKHPFVNIFYKGQKRRSGFPTSTSDRRSLLNQLGDIRRRLRDMGVNA